MSEQTNRTMAAAFERVHEYTRRAKSKPQTVPTHKQVVDAAWGNVAAENPKVTIKDAQRAIKRA